MKKFVNRDLVIPIYYHSANKAIKKDFKNYLKKDNRLYSILEEDAKRTILKKKSIDDLGSNSIISDFINLPSNYYYRNKYKNYNRK